jgi:protein ImuB
MGAAAGETPPWPGQLPPPAPAVVHDRAVAAELRDGDGQMIAISARGDMSGTPATLSLGHQAPRPVTAWAGPWPAEERWWDGDASRRRARVQLGLADGTAYVAVLEGGRWWVEATYD